jgi:antitoxin component YwqK of YwqJK toxin-antitoxin module
MKKALLLLVVFSIFHFYSTGQVAKEKILYIIDSIPVIQNPQEDNEIAQTDIADFTIIKSKDSLKLLGYEKLDGIFYVFTKEYRSRPLNIKQIPCSKQMEKKDGVLYFHGNAYSGPFIDYYYSGRKQEEGTLRNGIITGLYTIYYQNGKLSVELNYKDGIENGLEKEYYEDGSLKQKGSYINGKEEGPWDNYFPNGQLKQKSNFKNGSLDGETTIYYSTGKILAVELTANGKTTPDKRLDKIDKAMEKASEASKEGNSNAAIENCSKAISLDSTYAEAYFSRGTIQLNDFHFDEAILDFDKALQFEPYMKNAFRNRAFARIRKYEFASSRILSNKSNVTVLASKDKVSVPEPEQEKICNDLHKALLSGDKSKMTTGAIADYCQKKENQ